VKPTDNENTGNAMTLHVTSLADIEAVYLVKTITENVHCLCHSRQMILFRRILSFNFTLMPRKFFHLGDTIFPLEKNKQAISKQQRKEIEMTQVQKIYTLFKHITGKLLN